MTTQQIILLCIIVVVFIWFVTRFASYNYVMKNIPNLTEKIAYKMVEKDYKKSKKKFYNADGQVSAAAKKAIQSQVNSLNSSNQFYSKDFYYYYRSHHLLLKCRVDNMILNYMKESADITLPHNYNELTPEQFFNLRKKTKGDMVGVYIIYNQNKKMYYVGQATRLFFRVNQHFTGHGNGDVYADYKRGKDKFTIKLLPLVNSGYYDLDKLEKDMIAKYDSYNNGYNKTQGNG